MFKILLLLLLSGTVLLSAYGQGRPAELPDSLPEYEQHALYIQLAQGSAWGDFDIHTAADERLNAFPEIRMLFENGTITGIQQEFKVLSRKDEAIGRIYRILLAGNQLPDETVTLLDGLPYFDFVEKIPLYRTFYTPNDPAYADAQKRWHLDQINAAQAWDITQGCSGKTIAVVDDAVLTTHEDLAGNIFLNAGEIPGNGMDDDLNGYVDDVHGFDVADADPDPNPPGSASSTFFTHGTLVAGVAAGRTNNGTGTASIGFNSTVIPIKTKSNDEFTPGVLTNPMHGVEYAIAIGADVINMSWGSYASSQAHQLLFNNAYSAGQVTVAATGNQGVGFLVYPAAYDNVIAVAASDPGNDGATFSNVTTGVTVFAPGVGIWSCLADANNSYGYASGTSMAAPMVSGVAALMLCNDQTFTPEGIRNCIANSAAVYPSTLWPGLTVRILDAAAAVSCPLPFANTCTTEGCELIPNGGFEEPSNSSITVYGNFGWAAVSEGQVCGWESYLGTADVFPNPVAGFDNYAGIYYGYSPTPGWENYKEGIVTPELDLVPGQSYVLEFDASMAAFNENVPLDSLFIGLMSNSFYYNEMASPPDVFPTQQVGAVYAIPVDTVLTIYDQSLIMDGTIHMGSFFRHYTITFTMPAVTDMDRLVMLPYQEFQGVGYTNQLFLDNISLRASLSALASVDNDTIPEGACVHLSVSGSGSTFVWEPEALFSNPVGATQLSCPDTSVFYIATVYDAITGCTASDTVAVHVTRNPELGIPDLSQAIVNVYPNPVVGELLIEALDINAELEFGIYDCTGKRIVQGVISPDEATVVDFHHVASGIYVLRISNGQYVQVVRN